jgi:hypothetical protein
MLTALPTSQPEAGTWKYFDLLDFQIIETVESVWFFPFSVIIYNPSLSLSIEK